MRTDDTMQEPPAVTKRRGVIAGLIRKQRDLPADERPRTFGELAATPTSGAGTVLVGRVRRLMVQVFMAAVDSQGSNADVIFAYVRYQGHVPVCASDIGAAFGGHAQCDAGNTYRLTVHRHTAIELAEVER